jgi:RNA polymerase sigma factor (sigma-70 family)
MLRASRAQKVPPLNEEQRALVETCVHLAFSLSRPFNRRHRHTGIDFANEALLALTVCGSKFKPEFGVPFPAFVSTRVKLRLMDCVRVAGFLGYRTGDEANRTCVKTVSFNEIDERATPNRIEPEQTQFEREEEIAKIVSLANRLAKRRREVILLRYVEDLSPAEIATRLGITESCVWSNHHYAIVQLREFLLEKKRYDALSA